MKRAGFLMLLVMMFFANNVLATSIKTQEPIKLVVSNHFEVDGILFRPERETYPLISMEEINPGEVKKALLQTEELTGRNIKILEEEQWPATGVIDQDQLKVERDWIIYQKNSFSQYEGISPILSVDNHLDGGYDQMGKHVWNITQKSTSVMLPDKQLAEITAEEAWFKIEDLVQPLNLNMQIYPYIFKAYTVEDLSTLDRDFRSNLESTYLDNIKNIDVKDALNQAEDVYFICFGFMVEDLPLFGQSYDFELPSKSGKHDYRKSYGSAVVSKNGVEYLEIERPTKKGEVISQIAIGEPQIENWVSQSEEVAQDSKLAVKQVYLGYIIDVLPTGNWEATPYWTIVTYTWWDDNTVPSVDALRFDSLTGVERLNKMN